eukprot:TRINITY_DN67286_c0_g1_i1.p1 TRINITY_DN67286_c0_g1~~TRINITY_DN67286_c0_g1_i1.p1  ORF type:complete len:432 (-),score=52.70 TRINITY_DN67286_c0_g1_i1:197-1492(-)
MTSSSEAMEKQLKQQLFHRYNVVDLPNNTDAKARNFIKSREGDPIMIYDFGTVTRKWKQWATFFPRVVPYYAVKCNCFPPLIETLAGLGAHFDCASSSEVDLIVNTGVDPKNIIYANPIKQNSHMRHAKAVGVEYTTFDNLSELQKMKKDWPNAKVVLRIASENTNAQCELSSKFGCSMEDVPLLIKECKRLDLNLIGISFHVGSGCPDPQAWVHELHRAQEAMMEARSQGFEMELLDIGGGFPGDDDALFQDQAKVISPVIDELFPAEIRVIAEPGRYFGCAPFTLCCNVYGKRVIDAEEKKEYQYYLNDGVYQTFNCLFFDHATVTPIPYCWAEDGTLQNRCESEIQATGGTQTPGTGGAIYDPKPELRNTTLFGPTCDALDCIAKETPLCELDLGDWVVFENMGAYTMSAASSFNGFNSWNRVFCSSE